DVLTAVEPRYWVFMATWLSMSLALIGPTMLCLGVALPWLLEEQDSPARWGQLYALNTLGAVAGALGAAWVLLPLVGSTATAWIAGATLVGVAASVAGRQGPALALLARGGAPGVPMRNT